jgi:hypothetical protein
MQPFGYESNSLSNRRHVAVLTIPDSLPDLVGHVDHLPARADMPIAAMSDRLTGLGRHFEARSVPVRQELFKLGRTRMLRSHCFNRQSSPEKRRSPQRADGNGAPRRDTNSRPDLTVRNACTHFASMRRGKRLPTIVRIANARGQSSREGSGGSRRLEQAGAIAPLERGAKLR